MHWFEEKFAAIGRTIDHAVERVRDRRPARFKPRVGPSLGERIKDRVHDAKTAIATGEWREHAEIGEVGRRRLIVLGSVLLIALAASGIYHIVRPGPPRLNEQEIMDLAMIKARIELGGAVDRASDKPFGGFGAAPGSVPQAAGPAPQGSALPRPSAGAGNSHMPLPVRGGTR